MLKLAKYKEQRKFFVHFQKIIIKGNVCATFQLHTTCRCGKSFPFSMICLEAAIRFCQKLRWEGENGKILLNDTESKQNAWNHNRTKTSQQLEPNNHSRSLYFRILHIKGAFSDMRHFLATNSPLKLIKNAFYFTLKTFFFFKIFKFLSGLSDYVEKRLNQKDKVNFKTFDVKNCETNNCNTHTAQYLKK